MVPTLPSVTSGNPSARRFVGKTCLVTGAGAGIGRAVALRIAAEGGTVIAADSDYARAAETASLFATNITAQAVDVRDDASIACAAAAAPTSLDVLVNNAGIETLGTVAENSPEDWDDIMGVNLRGVFLMSRALLPNLLRAGARDGAAIVNNASLMGLVSSRRLAAYCASKAGVISLTRSMALDHAEQGLRVNCVCPGIIHTSMLERRWDQAPDRTAAYRTALERPPVKYLGRPEDVAAAVAYLASDEARFVTGAALTIDGGVGAA